MILGSDPTLGRGQRENATGVRPDFLMQTAQNRHSWHWQMED